MKLIFTGFLLIMPKTTKKPAEKAKVIGYLRVSTFSQELEKNKSAVGFASKYSAATPAACGAAIEVPLIRAVAESPETDVEVMLWPGAKMSTQDPKLDQGVR